MVKSSRKPGLGNSNLNGSTPYRPSTTGGVGVNTFSNPIKIKRPPNIFSDYGPDPLNHEKVHRPVVTKQSATWVVKKNDEMKYNTENDDNYDNPRTKMGVVPVKHSGLESTRVNMRAQAADKFFKLAKSRYGGADELFRALQKGKSDTLRLDEFSEMFRKRSLDLYFPRDQQRLFFEHFDTNHSSSIGVGDVIEQYQKVSSDVIVTDRLDQQHKRERNEKILSKIFKEREDKKLLLTPRQTTIQLIRALRNLDTKSTGYISKDELRWGLGKKYLNVPLTDDEIDAVVELCPAEKHNGKISYEKLAKMLQIKNSEPVIEPFFDARANQVTRLKSRIEALDKAINDEATVERRNYLMKTCHGDNSTVKSGGFNVYQNDSLSTLNKTVSCPELVLSQSPIRSCRQSVEPENEVDDDHTSSTHFLSNTKTRGKGGDQHLNSLHLSDEIDSSGPVPLMPGGKRLFHYAKFDETLLQHDSGLTLHRSVSGGDGHDSLSYSNPSQTTFLEDDRFRTTSSGYFAPLLYRPSVPVTRPNVLGDSLKCALERERRRKKRYERTTKNLQSFANFKELEDLSMKMNDDLRCKGRALESLQYESSALHNDLKNYSKQQGVTMQRKPNKVLYDKMWGGDKEQSRKPVDKPEDRDFTTTYQGSFVLHDE